MRPLLTDGQRKILNYIEREVRTTGVPPSIRQIGVAFGISATHGVHAHLQALEKKGYIHRSSRTSCGIAAHRHQSAARDRIKRSNWSRRGAGSWVMACSANSPTLAQRSPVSAGRTPSYPYPEPIRRTC